MKNNNFSLDIFSKKRTVKTTPSKFVKYWKRQEKDYDYDNHKYIIGEWKWNHERLFTAYFIAFFAIAIITIGVTVFAVTKHDYTHAVEVSAQHVYKPGDKVYCNAPVTNSERTWVQCMVISKNAVNKDTGVDGVSYSTSYKDPTNGQPVTTNTSVLDMKVK